MSFEYDSAVAMLAPMSEHFLVEPIIGQDHIRFDLLDGSYHILSSGEKAIVDLATGFYNGRPTENPFGWCIRQLDHEGLVALDRAMTIFIGALA